MLHRIFWTLRNSLANQSRHPQWYNSIQNFFGSQAMWQKFIQHYLPNNGSYRILDIGCGTAALLQHLPSNIQYTGIDVHSPYIESCRKRYPKRGEFICSDWSTVQITEPVDYVLLLGLLHHLNDDDAKAVIRLGLQHLNPKGFLLSLDGCREEDRSSVEELFYAIDRGSFVRKPQEYEALFPTKPEIQVHRDWLRVPYRYITCKLRKE